MEEKSGDEVSIYKELHLMHDTGAMYTKVTFLLKKVSATILLGVADILIL